MPFLGLRRASSSKVSTTSTNSAVEKTVSIPAPIVIKPLQATMGPTKLRSVIQPSVESLRRRERRRQRSEELEELARLEEESYNNGSEYTFPASPILESSSMSSNSSSSSLVITTPAEDITQTVPISISPSSGSLSKALAMEAASVKSDYCGSVFGSSFGDMDTAEDFISPTFEDFAAAAASRLGNNLSMQKRKGDISPGGSINDAYLFAMELENGNTHEFTPSSEHLRPRSEQIPASPTRSSARLASSALASRRRISQPSSSTLSPLTSFFSHSTISAPHSPIRSPRSQRYSTLHPGNSSLAQSTRGTRSSERIKALDFPPLEPSPIKKMEKEVATGRRRRLTVVVEGSFGEYTLDGYMKK